MAIASAGKVREVAGFSLEMFYKDRLHGDTDFFYFHPSKAYTSPILARLTHLQQVFFFFFILYISSGEERLHSLIENTVEINVFPTASLHLLQILD